MFKIKVYKKTENIKINNYYRPRIMEEEIIF